MSRRNRNRPRAPDGGAPKKSLTPLRPAAVAGEVFSHAVMLACALGFGIGYPGLMLMFMVEIVLGNLVSVGMYPERGLRRHLGDLVKIVFMMAFLMIFVVATYLAATDTGESGNPLVRLHFQLPAVLASAGLAVLRLAWLYVLARRAPEPKVAWASTVLIQNAATLVTLLLMIFVAGFAAAALQGTALPVDALFLTATAALRTFFAVLVSRMPEHEMRDMARQPYVD